MTRFKTTEQLINEALPQPGSLGLEFSPDAHRGWHCTELTKQAIYGLPISPNHLLPQLAGASFCVSYATRARLGAQLDQAIELVGDDGILMIDNGAFSYHKQGVSARDEVYLDAFEAWATDILERCPQAVAVIPDLIDGTEAENRELVNTTLLPRDRCMPVWHMHESIAYFLDLCSDHEYVAIGSSGAYWQPGTEAWHARVQEMFAALERWEAESNGAYIRPRLHMMRAQSQAHLYAFDSSDSCNVVVNSHRYRHEGGDYVARFAERASAKIRATSGAEAEHQIKRPLKGHLETAATWARIDALLQEAKDELEAPSLETPATVIEGANEMARFKTTEQLINEVMPQPGSLGLQFSPDAHRGWHCMSQNYNGPGDILGHGLTKEAAASDYCELYADREVVARLTEAFREINALGGLDGDNPHNRAIDLALGILMRLGAKPDFSKTRLEGANQ